MLGILDEMSEQSNGPRRPFKDASGPRRSFGGKPGSKPYAGGGKSYGAKPFGGKPFGDKPGFHTKVTSYGPKGKTQTTTGGSGFPTTPTKPQDKQPFPKRDFAPRSNSYPKSYGQRGEMPRRDFHNDRSGAPYKKAYPSASGSRFSPTARPLPRNIDERQRTTSWNDVAQWYDDHLTGDDTYHSQVILPNLVRLVNPRPGTRIVELGAGQGFFCREFAKKGAIAIGVEVSEKLVEIARTKAREENIQDKATFVVSSAEKADVIKSGETDAVLVVLALQNMHFIDDISAQISRILKEKGKAYIVLNHPTFRMPKQSSWGYDQLAGKQFRRIDRYMSELEAKIDMRPGLSAQAGETVAETISFHRPLSAYVTAFAKKGLAVIGMEEWISHRESQEGPRKAAEDTARKEIPLFMCMVLGKIDKE
jgi:ubiquinone/menaquinone biosynthesis C-methylase UbiE